MIKMINGIPCIVLEDETFGPHKPPHRGFTEIQRYREKSNLEAVLEELEKMFKGMKL